MPAHEWAVTVCTTCIHIILIIIIIIIIIITNQPVSAVVF